MKVLITYLCLTLFSFEAFAVLYDMKMTHSISSWTCHSEPPGTSFVTSSCMGAFKPWAGQLPNP